MAKSADPARFAQEQNIYYRDGLVRVTVELSGPDAVLPSDSSIQIEARSGNDVQALVPIGELCRLSNEPQVRSVMVPFEMKPGGR